MPKIKTNRGAAKGSLKLDLEKLKDVNLLRIILTKKCKSGI